ncbi:AIPR family protein [Autumnicola psychrophila]|uniref:AIPR family protein n=1 Tax=Autumnicola psychrophila TaxID=3075592 RepID=A0ABU3DQQ8_9FLAO|nr:AIPR family protein [Zunongwangia sp. F225]MDT0685859.1 AIPR family protein [Zunongwangia sp. F225]
MLQIRQIKKYLEEKYFDHVFLNEDESSKSTEQVENMKLTRSLCALAMCMQGNVEPDEACLYVTDGYDDNGLDGIYFDSTDKTLYLIQSKFHKDGTGSIDVGEIGKFLKGVKELLIPKYENFNKSIKERIPEIENYLLDIQTRFVLVTIHSGTGNISDHVQGSINDFLEDNNSINSTDIFSFKPIKINDIYSFISRGSLGTPIDSDLILYNWSKIDFPIKSYFGLVAGSDLANLYKANGRQLFSPNIRLHLGDTEVNEGISQTISEAPEKFWYYNNGITALANDINKKAIGGAGSESGIFVCKNLRVVNGAQTVGTITESSKSEPNNVEQIRIWIRIFEVSEENEQESKRITRTNNTQNRIDSRDFVSLDPQQARLKSELAIENINYVFRSGEFPEKDDLGFDLNEAVVAKACLHEDVSYSVQAKREISKLWNDIEKTPYKLFFNGSTDAIELSKEVFILQRIEKLISQKKNSNHGRDKLFVTHGNRFILHRVYKKLKEEEIVHSDISNEKLTRIFNHVHDELYDKVEELYSESNLGSLFKNTSKCKFVANQL